MIGFAYTNMIPDVLNDKLSRWLGGILILKNFTDDIVPQIPTEASYLLTAASKTSVLYVARPENQKYQERTSF
jgi:hypothetical protein